MTIRFTLTHGGVQYEGAASSPAEAAKAVAELTGKAWKVEPEVAEKVPGVFAEGDRVVFNQDYTCENVRKGDTGTVTGMDNDSDPLVYIDLDKGGSTAPYAFRVDHLKAEPPKLRVGARIKITEVDPEYNARGIRVGDNGTVSSLSTYADSAWAVFDRTGANHAVGGTITKFEVIG